MTDKGRAGRKAAGRVSSTGNFSTSAERLDGTGVTEHSPGGAACKMFSGIARQVRAHFGSQPDRSASPDGLPGRAWVRDVDRWFVVEVSPHERGFLILARRLTGNTEAAHDLVHDAYAELLLDDKWRTLVHPRAYLRRVIFNLGLNRLKRLKIVPMQQLAKVETVTYADLSPDAFEALSSRQELDLVIDALSKLPVRSRKVVMMRRLEGISPRDIASQMGISLSTVETHLANGLAALSDLLAEAEGEGKLSRTLPRHRDRKRE